jgi:hypothetical protein
MSNLLNQNCVNLLQNYETSNIGEFLSDDEQDHIILNVIEDLFCYSRNKILNSESEEINFENYYQILPNVYVSANDYFDMTNTGLNYVIFNLQPQYNNNEKIIYKVDSFTLKDLEKLPNP